jgi:NADH:ubiquinone oxidoreductase subunit C
VKRNAVASPFNETIYKFPFQLFIILEKMPVTFFTSEALTSNHYVMFIPKLWKLSFITALKYETSTSLSFLTESTIIDTYNYELFSLHDNYTLELSRLLRIDNYYSMFNKVRYTTIETVTKNNLYASSSLYKNAIWLEREFLEMYGTNLNTIYDTRNLLLEYSFTDNPMLKTYPTEGFVDIYYDFFRDQLCYVNHDYVEL